MGSSRQHLAAFARLHELGALAERRRAARQGLAMLAQIAEREPAPLEGLDANQLLLAVRAMLTDGVLGELDWLSPAAAAVAMFELGNAATNTEVRRASAAAGAALERGGQAQRWAPLLVERAAKEPGVTRGTILGIAGLAIVAPASADALATALVVRQPLEAAEAIAELRREEGVELLHGATAAALAWTRAQAPSAAGDDSRGALLQALERELGGSPTEVDGMGISSAAARAALDAGDTVTALREARMAVAEITEAADWLAQATDDDALDRRHSMRLLRELDRELLADHTLHAVLAIAAEHDPVRGQFAAALATIEGALLAREAKPESGGVQHGGLRLARLSALVRLLDGVRAAGVFDLGPRLAAVRQLMARA